MISIKTHPSWKEFVDRTSNLTGYYEDAESVYIAEEAHRSFGHLNKIKKSDLIKQLDKTGDDWEEFLDSSFEKLNRIYLSD